MIDHRRDTLRAGLAAIEGRFDEAAEVYRAALSGLRDLGAVAEEMLTGIDAVALLGEGRLDPALIAATRARIDELGAEGVRSVFEQLLRVERPTARQSVARELPAGRAG